MKFDYSCFNCGEEADCQFDPEHEEWFCEVCLDDSICFSCGDPKTPIMENNGFTPPNGPSHWEVVDYEPCECEKGDPYDEYMDQQ